jgi:hypothetical protein
MSAFDPLRTLQQEPHRSMVSRLCSLGLTISVGLVSGSCSFAPPPPGKPLVDGCYYADRVPILKVEGDKGTLLVPGNIREVRVRRDASKEQTGVTFTPGFHLQRGRSLTASLVTGLPHSSMMMKPFTDRPTIMAIEDPIGLIDLVQGPPC